MLIVHPTSLAATLDFATEAFFFNKSIPAAHCEELAMMLINRQNHSGTNSGFFIPFAAERETQSRLFSGEQLYTDFARSHIQLIESTRLLKLLSLNKSVVDHSIQIADQRMGTMCYSKFCPKGECKSLTIAYMRYLTTCDLKDSGSLLKSFLSKLVGYRDGKGKWNGFPFYYTLLMLLEVADPLATQELQYAAPICEKQRAQNWPRDPFSNRRQAIVTKALARI
jgi:hypothetical protein